MSKIEQIPLFYPRGSAAPQQGIAPIAQLLHWKGLLFNPSHTSSSTVVGADYIGPRPQVLPRGHEELLKQ